MALHVIIITSHLHYCNALNIGLPFGIFDWCSMWQPSSSLRPVGLTMLLLCFSNCTGVNMGPIKYWDQFKPLLLKTQHSLGPGYLKDFLLLDVSAYTLHSSGYILQASCPTFQGCPVGGNRARVFLMVAPKWWNSFPQGILIASSVSS